MGAALTAMTMVALAQPVAPGPAPLQSRQREEIREAAEQASSLAVRRLVLEQRPAESEALFRQALALRQRIVEPGHPLIADTLIGLGSAVARQGRLQEAERLYRESLAMTLERRSRRSANAAVELDEARSEASSLVTFSGLLLQLGRPEEAQDMSLRAVEVLDQWWAHNERSRKSLQAAVPVDAPAGTAEVMSGLRSISDMEASLWPAQQSTALEMVGTALQRSGRWGEAEAALRRSLELQRKATGDAAPDTTVAMMALARLLTERDGVAPLDEAEALARRSLAINQARLGDAHLQTSEARLVLGRVLQARGRWDDAAPELVKSYETKARVHGPTALRTLRTTLPLAQGELRRGRTESALALLRPGCTALAAFSAAAGETSERFGRQSAGACWASLAQALQVSAPAGAALSDEAFLAAQRAALSAAGDAIARSSARKVAGASGEGDAAADFEDALAVRAAADEALARSYRGADSAASVDGATLRQRLAAERQQAQARVDAAETRLRDRLPAYWELRNPSALPLAALQRGEAGRAPLLAEGEALVLWLLPPGGEPGLALAVSREGAAWARIALSTAEIDVRVQTLRAQIDPCAWGLAGADCRRPDIGAARAFDTAAAHQLHQALLGDPALQRVVAAPSVHTLLVVPGGSLTALPPGLLLTRPPLPGVPLAEQPWLARERAVALLPTVSALRTLRELGPAAGERARAELPLFMVADPDFAGSGAATAPPSRAATRALPPPAQAFFRDGAARGGALAALPRLPGTAGEASALRQLVQAREDDVLLGAGAREAALRERRQRLAQARVVAFATHGLVAGDLGLAEPALALAAPRPAEAAAGDDGLLSAGEVAALRLAADWVLLSACNTAAPQAGSAEGLSGLARAFFHAGARALLVSHWRVDDEATQALVTATFEARQHNPGLAKARAVQQASLAVMRGDDLRQVGDDDADLRDRRQRRGHPAYWAAFTLVGEPR